MNKKIVISLSSIIAISVSLFLGYIWGRSSFEMKKPIRVVEVKWTKGETIIDSVYYPVPKIEEVPVDRPIYVHTDTARLFEIWCDYYLNRKYDLDFSNDTIGTFKIEAHVNENKLISAVSTIEPNIRTVKEKEVIYKTVTAQPWVLIGSSLDLRSNKVQVGLDVKQKYIIGASAVRLDDKFGYTFDLGIKF